MPSYKILEEKEVAEGKIYTVRLIPNVDSEVDYSEIQEYLVKPDEVVEDVLSAAAWNHEDGVNKITEVVPPIDESEIEAIEAKPKEEINNDK